MVPKLLTLLILLAFALPVRAEEEEKRNPDAKSGDDSGYVIKKRKDGTTIKYKKKTTYDFEGTSVEGIYNKPSGSYISNIKDVKAKTIMRIRKNFDTEVVDSARMVK